MMDGIAEPTILWLVILVNQRSQGGKEARPFQLTRGFSGLMDLSLAHRVSSLPLRTSGRIVLSVAWEAQEQETSWMLEFFWDSQMGILSILSNCFSQARAERWQLRKTDRPLPHRDFFSHYQ